MAKFIVKKSELKNICKAVNNTKLAELKKEIIEILKKQDSNEFKKAIDYIESQELHFTHLEKSITGKWIEKAGYGIGTVRVWKGKKYKKIAPDKWVRVFDKEGRGTNIAIGKLIAKVKKIDNVEDLMAFVMANKQRFVDENGIDLPVLDKLRAAVDAKNNGNMGSSSKPMGAEQVKKIHDKIEENRKKGKKITPYEAQKQIDDDELMEKVKKVQNEAKEKNARKFGADWEDHRKEIQSKLRENTDKMFKDTEASKDVYEKLQIQLDKRKADAELYRKYLGNQEEPEDVKEFRKWCDDVIEQYKNEVSKTPSKEIISKWEETARNTPTEKLEEVLNGKQKIDRTNEYENFIDSTIINEFAKDKDLVFPQPYTALKTFAEHKFDDSDKVRLEVIKKELENRNKTQKETKESTAKKHKSTPAFEPVKSVTAKKDKIAETTKIEDGKVSIPATREIKNEIKNLLATAAKESNVLNYPRREFLAHVYYDGENLVSTDGKQMKVIKIGEIDGIEPNKYIKIDTTGKENIILEQDEKDYGFYPNYKRVIPDNNKQLIKFDNNALKDKIDEMKKDGSIDMELRQISLKLKDGGVFLDDVRVGEAKDVNFDTGLDYISFDYRLLTNALSGDESIMSVSGDPYKSVSISTKVSDNVFMPLRTSEVNYESNKEVNAARNEAQEKHKAQNEAEKEDRKKRSMTDETKSKILKDKPEGVTDSDYEDLIDYTNNFYVNLGYDNSTPRAKAEIKRTIDNAINQINNKDYAIFDMIQNSDNKVSRKIFETITALKLGSNRESAKKAWESWVGKKGVENHKKQLEAEQKQREENAKNEKLNYINSKMDQVSKYGGNISDDRKDVVRDYLLNLKVKKDEPTYRALFGQYKYKPNDDSEYVTNNGVNFVFDKLKGNGIEYFEKYYTSIRDKPMLNFARYVNATMNGDKIKKALFDTFLLDNFLMEDIDDMEEDEEERSLWNDYSAEQPELFNSTEFKVREAMNRHFCNCL